MNNRGKQEGENSVVLYGISKVEYGANGVHHTPCV